MKRFLFLSAVLAVLPNAATFAQFGPLTISSVVGPLSIDSSKLAPNSVDAEKIVAGAVDTDKLTNGAITNPKIATGAIDTDKLATDSVTTAKIYLNAVDSYKLKSDAGSLAQVSNQVMFNNAGKIGVGITNPSYPLHLYTTATLPVVYVRGSASNPATSGTTPNGVIGFNTGGNNGLYMGAQSASPYSAWLQVQDATDLSSEYPLVLNPNGGNVGIGTTAPEGILTVQTGAVDSTKVVAAALGRVGIGITNPTVKLEVGDGTVGNESIKINGANPIIQLANVTTTKAYLGLCTSPGGLHTCAANDLIIRTDDSTTGAIRIGNIADAAPMSILKGGNVGVGTTSPEKTLTIAAGALDTNKVVVDVGANASPKFGIGTTAPVANMHILSGSADTAKLQLGNATTPACDMRGVSGGGCAECLVTPGTFAFTCTTDADCVCDGS